MMERYIGWEGDELQPFFKWQTWLSGSVHESDGESSGF